jgi:succinate-semialdehyde dehydrogenase/glutarate-semialdehyde dehydrogenase
MPLTSTNPATGETLDSFEPHSAGEVDARLRRAVAAYGDWSHAPLANRVRVIARVGELLEERKEQYARLMTLEMGKLFTAAREEAAKCASACRYYAENAAGMLADQRVVEGEEIGYVAFHPLGPAFAIMPWNFPFWQVIRFAAPAVVSGNVGLLKHASNVPQCALALEQLFMDAGAPAGVFQTLLVGSDVVGSVIEDDRIAAVSLTGSEEAGAQVAARAGKHLKKQVLELGGSDAFVVMPSADLEKAVATAVRARTINNGQSCIAAKRFIVHERIGDDFVRRFTDAMRALRVGDPMDAGTQVGPLAMPQLVDDLDRQVRDSVAGGARLLTGGAPRRGRGFYYEPTVVTDIPDDSPAYRDELFGPVASVFRAQDREDAVRIANDTRFGLGAAAWTSDPAEARYFARELDAGTVFINGMVASDPRFPFGGVKASGYGRELSAFGLREWVNIKTVRMFGVAGSREHSGASLSE